jgi:nucleoid-associated protein Lsr2
VAKGKGLTPMAQRTVVTVLCDLPHDNDVEGTETVSFAIDGHTYEIDLCAPHGREIREKVEVFTNHGRRVIGGRRRKTRSGRSRERNSDIRAWARKRGQQVSDRGRIPDSVIAAYEASH